MLGRGSERVGLALLIGLSAFAGYFVGALSARTQGTTAERSVQQPNMMLYSEHPLRASSPDRSPAGSSIAESPQPSGLLPQDSKESVVRASLIDETGASRAKIVQFEQGSGFFGVDENDIESYPLVPFVQGRALYSEDDVGP